MQESCGFIGRLQAAINQQRTTFNQGQQAGKQVGEFWILLFQVTARDQGITEMHQGTFSG